jgi:hypothetical protein
MGSGMSKSGNCENYKSKINDLNKELNEFRSGRMAHANANDPYNEYTGGRKKRNTKKRRTRRRKY